MTPAPSHCCWLWLKTPMNHRTFALLLLGAALLSNNPNPVRAQASPIWTVDDAVRVALDESAMTRLQDATIRSHQTSTRSELVRPNPTLGLDYEQLVTGRTPLEVALWVEQELDLSDWRRGHRESAKHVEAGLRANTAQARRDLAGATREAFFAVVYRQARQAALVGQVERLRRGVAALRAREASGDVPRYAVLRAQREVTLVQASIAAEQAQVAEAWASLQSLAPFEQRPTLVGDITVPVATTVTDDDQQTLHALPLLQQLRHQQQAIDARRATLGSRWLRGWTVGAGYRLDYSGTETGHGFLLSLAVPLAISDDGSAHADALAAESQRLNAEHAQRLRQLERSASAARARVAHAQAAIAALPNVDSELSALAEAAYAAGEVPLSEVLETQASEVELALVRLDLQWQARRAELALARIVTRHSHNAEEP